MNVTTTFLNGMLKEKIYLEPLEGYIHHGDEDKVCLVLKYLYGLK